MHDSTPLYEGAIPRAPAHVLERSRLLRVLDGLAPVSLLVGAAGMGKTTLAAQWARQRRASGDRVAWIAAGRLRLSTLLDAAATSADPGSTIVVVDDAHRLTAATLDALVTLCRNRDDWHALLIDGADVIEHRVAGLDGLARIIGGRDLELTEAETRALAARLGREDEAATTLRAILGGWVGPLRVAIEHGLDASPFEAERVLGIVRRALETAAREHGLRLHPSDGSSSRLLRTLGLTRTNLEGASSVLPVVRSVLLDEHEDEDERWGHLLTEATTLIEPVDVASLQHARDTRDWRHLEHAWTTSLVDLLRLAPEVLRRVYGGLPPEALQARRALAHATAAAALRSSGSAAGLDGFWRGHTAAPGAHATDPAGYAVALNGTLVEALRRAKYGRAAVAAASLREAIGAAGANLSPRTHAYYEHQIGRALLLRADPTVAPGLSQLVVAHEAAQLADDVPRTREIAAVLAALHASLGISDESRRWRIAMGDSDSFAAAVARAQHRLDTGASGGVAVLREVEEHSDDVELWSWKAWLRAQAIWFDPEPTASLAYVDDLVRRNAARIGDSRFHLSLVHRANAECSLAAGYADRAASAIASSPSSALVATSKARLELQTGYPAAALRTAAAHMWHPELLPRDRVDLSIVRCEAHLVDDCLKDAAQAAQAAVAFAEQTGTTTRLRLASTRAWALMRPGISDEAAGSAVQDASARPHLRLVDLTPRERIVLEAADAHGSNEQIAAALNVSINTVRKQLASSYRKLGVSDRRTALAEARRLGLL